MATFIVDTIGDGIDGDYSAGHLTLREAIALANANPGADRIVFAASLKNAEIILTQGELFVTDALAIDGDTSTDGRADVTISGSGQSRIFNVAGDGASLAVDSLALADGFAYSGTGGAIYANYCDGITIRRTTFSDCMAAGGGGAIYARSTALDMAQSLFTGNGSGGNGGGIYLVGGIASIANTTFNGNCAAVYGGGLSVADGADVTLANCTITANSAWSTGGPGDGGGGIDIYAATLVLTNTVVATNVSGPDAAASDLHGAPLSLTSCFIGGDPKLGQLLDNGGAVLTRSPLDGSPLIDAGSLAGLAVDTLDLDGDGNTGERLPVDGREGLRMVGSAIDIGAVEQIVDEKISGTSAADLIVGGLGDDVLKGLGGGDTVIGGPGADRMWGGGGIDLLSYAGSASGVTVSLATGLAAGGDATGDTFFGFKNLRGSGRADVLTGNDANNRIMGGAGADVIIGLGGQDRLAGEGGADIFVFTSLADSVPNGHRDVILDFNTAAHDLIDLSAIDAVAGGGDDAFHFTGHDGTDPFSGTAGELRLVLTSSKLIVRCDVDGDRIADFDIGLLHLTTLGPDDVIL
jgi:Ca2+-binding RTX toxin-like protein